MPRVRFRVPRDESFRVDAEILDEIIAAIPHVGFRWKEVKLEGDTSFAVDMRFKRAQDAVLFRLKIADHTISPTTLLRGHVEGLINRRSVVVPAQYRKEIKRLTHQYGFKYQRRGRSFIFTNARDARWIREDIERLMSGHDESDVI